jgi:DNA-binding NarL/FixJ family response regulator
LFSHEKVAQLSAIGVHTYLPKPYTAQELFGALQDVLSKNVTLGAKGIRNSEFGIRN